MQIEQGQTYRLKDPNYITRVVCWQEGVLMGEIYRWKRDTEEYEYVKDISWKPDGTLAKHCFPFVNISHKVSMGLNKKG